MEEKEKKKIQSFFRNVMGKKKEEVTQTVIDFIAMTNPRNRPVLLEFLNEYAKTTGDFDLVKKALKSYVRIENGENKKKVLEDEFDELSGHQNTEDEDYSATIERSKKRISEMMEDQKMEKSLQRFSRPQVDYIDFLFSDKVSNTDERFIGIKHYANFMIDYGEDTEFAKEYLGLSDSEITQARLWKELYFISRDQNREDVDDNDR